MTAPKKNDREVLYTRISLANALFIERKTLQLKIAKSDYINALLDAHRLNKKFDMVTVTVTKPFLEAKKKRLEELKMKKKSKSQPKLDS